jgi:hypothetical protein
MLRRRSCFVSTMRRTRWLCSGLASVVAASGSVCATLAACSDEEVAEAPADAGLIDTSRADVRSATPDAGAAGTPRLTFVNAAHDLGPTSVIGANAGIRLCFKQGSMAQNLSIAPFPPLPDRAPPGDSGVATAPGIYLGTGAMLPAIGLNFEGRIIVPILMNVKSLSVRGLDKNVPGSRGPTCDELIGDIDFTDARAPFVENVDYWVLPQIEAGTLANEKAYLLALTGCVGNATTINPGKCGPGFVGGGPAGIGNLKLTHYETTRSPVVAPFGAQLLYLSTQANAFFSQAAAKGAIQPGFVSSVADGRGFRAITDFNPPVEKLSEVVPVVDVKDSDAFVFGPKSLNPAEAALGMPLLATSLLAMQAYSGIAQAAAPAVYQNGRSYVFIAVGDPDINETPQFVKLDGTAGGDGGSGSRFNTRFFHFLAYPTDPTALPYSAP